MLIKSSLAAQNTDKMRNTLLDATVAWKLLEIARRTRLCKIYFIKRYKYFPNFSCKSSTLLFFFKWNSIFLTKYI